MTSAPSYADLAVDFDPVWPEDHDWLNVHDGHAVRIESLRELLSTHIRGDEVVVVVHTTEGVGARLQRDQVCDFVAPYVLKAEIQIADLDHSSCVAILRNGVASGWARV